MNTALAHNTEGEALKLYANVTKGDPTHTAMIRRAFVAEAVRRFRGVQRDVRATVVANDALGLEKRPRSPFQLQAAPRKAFQFRTSAGKVEGFMEWLEREVSIQILEGQGRQVAGSAAWANKYVDTSYKQGIRRANQEMVKGGYLPEEAADATRLQIDAAFNAPIHADRVGLIYTRVFSDLKGITQAMDQQISRVLASGIASGLGPAQIARQIVDRIDKIGITRARILARTEVIRAHHVATINTYREAGIEGVKVKAEWSTAGDDRVCPDCGDMEGRVFPLDEMEDLIPFHPQCRCVALPADVGEKKTSPLTREDRLGLIGDQYPTKEGFVKRRGYWEEKTGKKALPGSISKTKKTKVAKPSEAEMERRRKAAAASRRKIKKAKEAT